jgi:uncharacterized membrane protein YphA (DoxX/SURF4 family)
MTPYAWSCLACEESNPPAALRCGRCQCPAQATSAQAEVARRTWRQRAGLPAEVAPSPLAVLRQLPLLLIAAAVLLLLGALLLIVNLGASPSSFGGLLIALAALCASSHRQPATTAD